MVDIKSGLWFCVHTFTETLDECQKLTKSMPGRHLLQGIWMSENYLCKGKVGERHNQSTRYTSAAIAQFKSTFLWKECYMTTKLIHKWGVLCPLHFCKVWTWTIPIPPHSPPTPHLYVQFYHQCICNIMTCQSIRATYNAVAAYLYSFQLLF